MSEETKKKIVDMNPVTIEARDNAAGIERVKEEADLGGDIADYLEKEAEKQGLLSDDTAKSAKEAAIDEMEKASQKALEAMRIQGGEEADKIVDEAEVKLDNAFKEFRTYVKDNANPEKVKKELEGFSKEVSKVLKASRDSIEDTVHSEQFQSTMKAGQDFIKGTGTMIGDGLKYGYDKAMEVPEIKKVADKVDEGVDKIRQSDFLREIVNGAEKGINDFSSFIFSGINSFFDAKDTKEAPKAAPKEDDTKKAE